MTGAGSCATGNLSSFSSSGMSYKVEPIDVGCTLDVLWGESYLDRFDLAREHCLDNISVHHCEQLWICDNLCAESGRSLWKV